ncbi:MAG: citrate lyase acyl carrier protein [Clostridiales Family XIII bacterium]|nr:citrate lyase acyl carrier protein [Clostridiales Family XIII bacterium]
MADEILTFAQAGSENKGDALVSVSPNPDGGIQISIAAKAIIRQQFGEHIENLLHRAAAEKGIGSARIEVKDCGALDYVIRARLFCAMRRSGV